MRFTHPVNTLKKLGCGLAFGAAAIMAMPTSALACTQIYMGSQLTADGAYRTKCVSTLGASAQVDAPFSAV